MKPSYGLGDDEIARMLKDSISHAADDATARALREKQVDARRLIEATTAALSEDAGLLDTQERADIDRDIKALAGTLESDDSSALSTAMDVLIADTENFAARRMNQSVRRALAGKKIEEIG